MSLDISGQFSWENQLKKSSPILLGGKVFRIVESQEKVATNELVDTLEEQALLEEMLEQTKPAVPLESKDFSYFLFTPFRYPPLKYGSRFGARFEPSLFYGSRTLKTALAETAYYRLHFWFDMSVPPPSAKLKTQHTAFTVQINTGKGLKLQDVPFSKYESALTNKSSYSETQALGKVMRVNNIDAFEFISARDSEKGLNVGLFKIDALSNKKPTSIVNVFCSTHNDGVEFMDENSVVYQYSTESFLDRSKFPKIMD